MPKGKYILIGLLIFVAIIGFSIFRKKENPSTISQISNAFENVSEKSNSSNPSAIDNLRNREYEGSQITIEDTLSENNNYIKYRISYLSDGLKIYAAMNVPKGNGPFPVIILNHGYFNASSFNTGDGTQTMADILANNSYLTLASDYRGFGQSEDIETQQSRGHRPDYAIDVINLVASVKNLQKADAGRIGMWGYSMGGEVSLRTAEVTDKLKAIVLWAPTSGNAADNANFYGSGKRSPSPANSDLDDISPINYLKYVNAAISLHQGLSDTEVNPEWSKELKSALEKEGKQVEYFEYPGQDHNFRNLGWDDVSQKTVEFFNRYLKS